MALLLGLAAPAAAQSARNFDIHVADAYEGENIIVTLTLSSAPGSVSAAQRTFTVSTEVPSVASVNTCIATYGCTAGSVPASASDFTALASTNTVVFGANETTKTVTISTATDNLSEGLEVVKINISYSPDGGSLGIFTTGRTGSQYTGRRAFDSVLRQFSTSLSFNTYGNISNGSRPAPEISVSLPIIEGESRSDAGEKKVAESEGSVGIGFNLAADQPLPSALTVCVRVTESGGDRVASGSEGIQTVNMPSSVINGSGTHTLTWTNTAADDQDSSVTVEAVAPNTASCSATNGSYTVSSSDASDKLLIQDDEDTTVELTSTDATMTEGDASDTATLTVALSRQLYAGETIGVPIALASATGARLPGSVDGGSTANHDFTVGAAAGSGHSGVTLTNALTANPRVVFTGHDTNTVQTATVTLTPVANRDDGDAAHETITATLTSLGLLDTTVSGVAAHASNNTATLTLEDDEAPPPACSAQNNSLSVGSVRVLENGGMATYCVRLPTAPSGGDTTVTIGTTGRYTGAANASTTTLTFTASNYQTPQQVTVTGVDQPNLHLNRTLSLTHAANGGGYSNQGLGWVSVTVDDAPELEAWDLAVMNVNDYAAKQRPNTVKATRGFRYFQNDMTPIYPLRYQLRLSNRPATGETVTVTATSSDISKFGLSLTSGGPPQASLTVTFEDRDADRVCFNGGHSSLFDVYTSNPDASWACYRQIWVISTQQYATFRKGCANITHTASGGGLRSADIGTIRAHAVAGTVFAPYSAPGSDCPLITEELRNRSAPATAAPAPTEAVSNLQVTAVDDVSARITWDAVEHATSYEVSWSTESSDSLAASAGAFPGVTGTTTTIQHDALVPMTLTVTVTPEYIDENGVTQQLDALASTATLAVGPLGQRLDSGGGTNGGDGGSIDAGFGAVDLPVPVSHWRFEDDAVDWVGSSHGTEKGGIAFEANEEGEGVGTHALSLDGTDDYIDLASHVSDFPLGDSTRSVTGWFKADTGNQRQTFFTYGPNVEGKRFSIAADRTQVLVAVSGHAWGVNGLELKDGWHHVAVTYAGGDSDDILIYLDGELQSASTLAGSSKQLDTQTGPAAIGRSVSGTKYYTGLIDDVRLYDVALSAEQVLALFEEHPQTVLAEDNPEVCVSEELLADVEGYSKETWRESADHVERWLRVLETFSGTASNSRVMTPTEAEGYVNRGWPRWEPVVEALECMEEGNE